MMNEKAYSIKLSGKTIVYTVRLSKRAKYLKLSISRTKGVEVVTPNKGISKKQISDLIQSHSDWIFKKLEHIEKTTSRRLKNALEEHSVLLFLGQEYQLRNDDFMDYRKVVLRGTEFYMNLTLLKKMEQPQNEIRAVLKKWYIKRAKNTIKERVEHYKQKLNVRFNRVSIKNQQTRWGSCSALKNLNFNWRLILAPPEILDYIIIHEMAHLIELNHSVRFWRIVESYCPNYQQYDKWLTMNGHNLTF